MKRVAVVMGGYSSEHQISLKSGQVVFEKLDRTLFEPYRVVIQNDEWFVWFEDNTKSSINRHDFSFVKNTTTFHFDVVFNVIHGTPGEDGKLIAYFELLHIPHTSCDSYQSALTFNKRDLLSVLKPFGIPMAKSYFLNKGDSIDANEIGKKVGFPCFVKPNRSGSSYGISKVYAESELDIAIEKAFAEDTEILIESFLKGTEVSVGVIQYKNETKVLPITEIVSENDFFDYEAKYQGKSKEITPARLTKAQEINVSELALKVYKVLNMKGFSRSEYIFVDDTPHLLEMNTVPGMTSESILPQQAKAAGIEMSELLTNAIEMALHNKNK
jgi:D-alanine-D-alanine ligase